MNNRNEILMSCVVITYNSASALIETHESAKNQTYPNIELIISNDCYNDDTVAVF
jgi:alpha-1,3-rhamnosyltransferase